MHIGTDSEEKAEGGFQDSLRHQYLKMIWIERLLMKFSINLIPPPFFQLLLFNYVLIFCCE